MQKIFAFGKKSLHILIDEFFSTPISAKLIFLFLIFNKIKVYKPVKLLLGPSRLMLDLFVPNLLPKRHNFEFNKLVSKTTLPNLLVSALKTNLLELFE